MLPYGTPTHCRRYFRAATISAEQWRAAGMGTSLVRTPRSELCSVFIHVLMLVRRRKGIEARRKFVAPVGAWFSQIGRLHQVYHMWQYP